MARLGEARFGRVRLGEDFTYIRGKVMYGLAGRGEVWKYAHSWQGKASSGMLRLGSVGRGMV